MKIIHLADLHLGYRSYNKVDKIGINMREKDVIKAFKESLDKISVLKPDLIVIAGDIFHRPRPSNLTIYNTIILLNEFRQACSAPIIMIAGNHEAYKSLETGSVLRIIENSVPNIYVADYNIEYAKFDKPGISVLCVPHGGLTNVENFALIPDKAYKYNLMAIHGTYEHCKEITGYGNGAFIKESDLNQAEWDYIAFGHYHKFTELAPNCYYSGAIERTTTNVWQEADDKKGFIEYDLETKICKFHSLESPRKVFDIKDIDAKNLTGEEINRVIEQEVLKIKDFDKSIVRITVKNIDSVSIRELDYKKIREYKKTAVHFRLNLQKKDANVSSQNGENQSNTRKGIVEILEEDLLTYEISHELDSKTFKTLAVEYLQESMAL